MSSPSRTLLGTPKFNDAMLRFKSILLRMASGQSWSGTWPEMQECWDIIGWSWDEGKAITDLELKQIEQELKSDESV